MPLPAQAPDVAEALRQDVDNAKSSAKRLKVRSLLRKFGYVKRSDSNTAEITECLNEFGIAINPPIVRLGNDWELGVDDWVYLSTKDMEDDSSSAAPAAALPSDWNADGWFDDLERKELRTEKEVEIKFIVPLLAKLGFGERDRYDGMPVPAAHGSRATTLVIDFALFNDSVEALTNQPLLTVEAKKEERLTKAKEIRNAHNQAKSYCLWTQCDYFMITDSRTIQVFHICRGGLDGPDPLFSCTRQELKAEFATLYRLLSKDVLTEKYLKKVSTTDEAG